MFMASKTVPWLQLPSPPKAMLTLPVAALRQARRADGQRRAAADDAVGAEHALGEVGDVHRAALALAEAVGAAVDLEHHALHVAALGDAVPVAAMRADDVVGVVEVLADADRDRFLARIEVREAGDLARGDFHVQPLLEFADGLHLAVGALQALRRKWCCHVASLRWGVEFRLRRGACRPAHKRNRR